MNIPFIIYLLCISVIFAIILLSLFRNKFITDYRNNYTNHEKLPLKYIPKKIFQLIADKNKISPEFKWNINYMKNLNPDWEYKLYDDIDIVEYISKNYGENMLNYYNKINPKYGAAKADFFRYLLMYKEGGVYLDIKSAITQPLSEVLLPDDEYILSYWDLPVKHEETKNKQGELQQWHIICRSGHPFLYNVIQTVIKNIDNYDFKIIGGMKGGVLTVTGPYAYSKAILPIMDKYKHRMVDVNDCIGLTYTNIGQSHKNLFSKTHYSKINEPIILK